MSTGGPRWGSMRSWLHESMRKTLHGTPARRTSAGRGHRRHRSCGVRKEALEVVADEAVEDGLGRTARGVLGRCGARALPRGDALRGCGGSEHGPSALAVGVPPSRRSDVDDLARTQGAASGLRHGGERERRAHPRRRERSQKGATVDDDHVGMLLPWCCRRRGSSRSVRCRRVPCVKSRKPRNPAETRAMRCVLGSPARGLGLGLVEELRRYQIVCASGTQGVYV